MEKNDLEITVDHDRNRMTIRRLVKASEASLVTYPCDCGGCGHATPIKVTSVVFSSVEYDGPILTCDDVIPTRS